MREDVDLEQLTEREARIYEIGYVAGAVYQWRRMLALAQRELHSYGVVVEVMEDGEPFAP